MDPLGLNRNKHKASGGVNLTARCVVQRPFKSERARPRYRTVTLPNKLAGIVLYDKLLVQRLVNRFPRRQGQNPSSQLGRL